MAAPTEVLPPGNRWELSARNWKPELQPGPGVTEITEPNGILREVVSYVEKRFIKEDWQFASLVQVPKRVNDSLHLVAVFTHPLRNILVAGEPGDIGQFVKVDASLENNEWFNSYFPADDPINEIIKGTNRAGAGIFAGYNAVWVAEDKYPCQPGVGYFDMRFPTLDEHIAWENQRIDELTGRLTPHLEEKAKLEALKVPNPRQLFQ